MTDFMDLTPVFGSVQTSKYKEPVPVPGISATGLMQLIQQHPELLPIMKGQAGDITLNKMLALGKEFTLSFVATGLGQDPAEKAVRDRVKVFTPEDLLDLGEEIMKQSFPGGLESFLARVTKALEALKDGVEQTQGMISSQALPAASKS